MCPPVASDAKQVVLHLAGSSVSQYYRGVSEYYATQCFQEVVQQGTFDNRIAVVHSDGTWTFPADFSEESIAKAEHVTFAEAVTHIKAMNVAAMVPHMFCLPGMTTYRALFELMQIPVVGNPHGVMETSTNKAQTKAIVQAAGVQVPQAEILRKGDKPTMQPPFILKPCNEDNSQGITLFKGEEGEDLDVALKHAFSFDTEVLCERYIALGREVRCGVLENADGSLTLLPCLEYFLTENNPIRAAKDKLIHDKNGVPVKATSGGRQCPADIDAVLWSKLEQLAFKSHRALGCRDYSLYDVRVDPAGEPYFIEACLYCSFAPRSVIVSMHIANGGRQQDIFEMMVNRGIDRRSSKAEGGTQVLGMKAC